MVWRHTRAEARASANLKRYACIPWGVLGGGARGYPSSCAFSWGALTELRLMESLSGAGVEDGVRGAWIPTRPLTEAVPWNANLSLGEQG